MVRRPPNLEGRRKATMMTQEELYQMATDRLQDRRREAAQWRQVHAENEHDERERLIDKLARTYASIAALLA
jgi:hypothetical protein